MNKLILLTTAAMITFGACAQKMKEKDVPEVVSSTFEKEYPGRTNVKWEKKGSDYRAKYKDNGEDISALYDKNGKLIELEHKIAWTNAPTAAKTYMDKNAPGKTVTEAYMVTDKDGNVLYNAVIEETEYVFDSDGEYKSKKSKKIRQ